MIGYLLGKVVGSTLIISLYAPTEELNKSRTLKYSLEKVGKHGKYALSFSAMSFVGWLSNYLERYLAASFIPMSGVGVYVASAGLVNRPYNFLTSVLSTHFKPGVYSESSSSSSRSRIRAFGEWLSAAVILGLFGTFCVYLFGHYIISIVLGAAVRKGAFAIILILSISGTAVIATHTVDNLIFAQGKSYHLLAPQLLAIFLLIALMPILYDRYGMIGVAVAKALCSMSNLVFTSVYAVIILRAARRDC